MKRFRDFLLSIFIFASIVIFLFIILSFFNIKRTIYLSNNENIEVKLNNLKFRVGELSDGKCKTFLNSYIEHVDKGYFDGEVKLKDLYEYYWNYPTLKFYKDAIDSCDITEHELFEYGVAGKWVNNMVLPDTLFDKYMFSYELNLKDNIRTLSEPNVDNLTYSSIRFNQIEILNDYVQIAENKEATNE